jgi:hypothetical protein
MQNNKMQLGSQPISRTASTVIIGTECQMHSDKYSFSLKVLDFTCPLSLSHPDVKKSSLTLDLVSAYLAQSAHKVCCTKFIKGLSGQIRLRQKIYLIP